MEIVVSAGVGILIYCVIVMALRGTGMRADAVKRRLYAVDAVTASEFVIDDDMSKPLVDRLFKPALKSFAEKLSKLMPKSAAKSGDSSSKGKQGEKLRKMLLQAGFALSVAEYNAIRFSVMIGLALILALLLGAMGVGVSGVFLGIASGLFIGYVAMRYYLAMMATKRRTSVERQLPDVLDLLSISVEAGLSFEQAVGHLVENMEGPLIDELMVTYREMSMGRSRRDALILLGERCDVEDVKSFVGAIVQAGELGISIKNVLRSQSVAMRQSRKAKVQEKAAKVSIKILIPMLLFIFPVLFIVLLGPAAVNIVSALG